MYSSFNKLGALLHNSPISAIVIIAPVNRWFLLGSNAANGTNGVVYAIALDSSNNQLYVGGTFTTVYDLSNTGGLSANRIARWNIATKRWYQFGNTTYNGVTGTSSEVRALALDSINNTLYVGGTFTSVIDATNTSGIIGKNIAKWNINTETWSIIGYPISTVIAIVLDSTNNQLYAGGAFSSTTQLGGATLSTKNVARLNINDGTWYPLGINTINGTSSAILALALDSSNNSLYAGGNFITAQDAINTSAISVKYVARWDIAQQRWFPLGNNAGNGTTGQVNGLAIDIATNSLYVGGIFGNVSDSATLNVVVNRIAEWKIATQKWSLFGNSTYKGINSGQVNAISLDALNRRLYVGGTFTAVQDVTTSTTTLSANRIAQWDITQQRWFQLGNTTSNGTNGNVNTLKVNISNNQVYVGGTSITTVYDVSNTLGLSANIIAQWDV